MCVPRVSRPPFHFSVPRSSYALGSLANGRIKFAEIERDIRVEKNGPWQERERERSPCHEQNFVLAFQKKKKRKNPVAEISSATTDDFCEGRFSLGGVGLERYRVVREKDSEEEVWVGVRVDGRVP